MMLGMGYCKTARSCSNFTRVTDRYCILFGNLIPWRKKSAMSRGSHGTATGMQTSSLSDNSCSHVSLSIRHILLDEVPSLSTQPCQDITACGSSKAIVSPQFNIQLGTSTITPSKTARNLCVVIDVQMNFSDHIAKTAGPAYLLCSASRRSGPFFWNMLQNSLFKLIFYPDWTIAMLSLQVFQTDLSNLYN